MTRSECWKENPALLIALHVLFGVASAIHWHWIYIGVFVLIWASRTLQIRRAVIYLGIALVSFGYALFLYPPVSFPEKKMEGMAHFSISGLSLYASPFKHLYLYKGTLKSFDSVPLNLPCKIYLPVDPSRPKADKEYLIQGTLIQKSARDFLLKPSRKLPWKPIPDTFSFAEWRHRAKESVKHHLKQKIPNHRSYAFLSALFTGELDERGLSLEFNHLGLQHILAISGFHFTILAAFFGFFLRLIFPYKLTAIVLLCLITCYFVFIGSSPSVQRAWIALAILLVGHLCNFRSSGLNALGVGVIVALFIDPLLVTHLGFQLSFLATTAIFLLYPTLNRLFSHLMPKRTLTTVAAMTPLNQHGYLLSAFIRETASLSCAVHLFVLPIILTTFHKFPYLSLLYNLFFPFWTSLVFFLFLLALPLTFLIPPLGTLLHAANSAFTSALLELTAHPPPMLDFSLHCGTIPFPLLISLLAGLFFLSIETVHANKA